MELVVEEVTKEGKAFQDLTENHSQVISECQLKLKYLIVEAGDLDLVGKKKLPIMSFMELVHNISKVFLTYNDKKDIYSHQCSIDVIKLYSDHIAVHIDASKEALVKEYKKNTNSKKCPGTVSLSPDSIHLEYFSFYSHCSLQKLWRADPAPSQLENRRSRVNQQQPHGRFQKHTC